MPSRNCLTRPVSWRRSSSEQVANAIKEGFKISPMLGWVVSECHIGVLTSRDNLGRMEGGKYQLRDWFFTYHENITPDDVEKALKILHNNGLIIHYQVRGIWYIQLPKIGNWSRLVGNMQDDSDFPPPDAETIAKWQKKTGEEFTPFIPRINLNNTAYRPEGKREVEVKGKREVKRERESKEDYLKKVNEFFKNITDENKIALAEAHPEMNIDLELKKAKAWLISNTENRKKKFSRFVNNWMNRAEEYGNGKNGNSTSSTKYKFKARKR
jgi:hypothetical protein